MSIPKAKINSVVIGLAISVSLSSSYLPSACAQGELNFKVYSPDASSPPKLEGGRIPAVNDTLNSEPTGSQPTTPVPNVEETPAPAKSDLSGESGKGGVSLSEETPVKDAATTPNPPVTDSTKPSLSADDGNSAKTEAQTSATKSDTGSAAAKSDTSNANVEPTQSSDSTSNDSILEKSAQTESTQSKSEASDETKSKAEGATSEADANKSDGNKVLKGYVQVVPSGTKIPIIMDTAVDSDTSQEGDEFSARTAEDLTIDGSTVVPAGSIIRGRIATINAPKHLDRSGSVALKFDTVTTPDNRQIPLVANIVARGGVVHARRGLKDIAIDTSIATLPSVVGVGIGAVAGNSSSKVGVGGGALIGAGVGIAVGVAILLAKKGKKVDVRPGEELKIELAEDLHMPTM